MFADRPGITTADTGLGTTYERWALNRYLANLAKTTGIRSALEGPGDGMTGIAGINSLILGLNGVDVKLLLADSQRVEFAHQVWKAHAPKAVFETQVSWDSTRLPEADQTYDLVWNFNIMTRQERPFEMLQEMQRVSRKWVLVFVPNRRNYAFWLHRLHHRVAKDPWDHGRIDLMQPDAWEKLFWQAGLQPRQIIWLDCPWWPDIVDLGQLIADFFPPMKKLAQKAKPENRLRWPADELPYYRPETYPEVHSQMERLAYFEKHRWTWLKQLFAHHVGMLGEKVQD